MRSLIALAIPLLGWVCVAGCSNSSGTSESTPGAEKTKQAILRVLRADEQLAKKRDSLPPNATPSQISWAIGEYRKELGRLDMSDCPPDFRVAYRHHISAWGDAEAAIKQVPEGFLEGVFVGAMNSLLHGEIDGGGRRLEGNIKRELECVRDSWFEVEKIGAKYGAAL
jgi:hypothetical protein